MHKAFIMHINCTIYSVSKCRVRVLALGGNADGGYRLQVTVFQFTQRLWILYECLVGLHLVQHGHCFVSDFFFFLHCSLFSLLISARSPPRHSLQLTPQERRQKTGQTKYYKGETVTNRQDIFFTGKRSNIWYSYPRFTRCIRRQKGRGRAGWGGVTHSGNLQ